MNHDRRIAALFLALALTCRTDRVLLGADEPATKPALGIGFRGDGSGVFSDAKPPTEFDAIAGPPSAFAEATADKSPGTTARQGKNLRWKAALPNHSNSSPIVVGDPSTGSGQAKVFVVCAAGWPEGQDCAQLLCFDADTAGPRGPAGTSVVAPLVAADWPSYLGPSHAFADAQTPPVRLLDDIARAKPVWRSEEGGIGFGKAYSQAMRCGFAKGSGLLPSGAATPILADGLVIQFYCLPRGPLLANAPTEGPMKEFELFFAVSADDVVVAIDAATGKTCWKAVFEGQGLNYGAGKRGEFSVTPCAADGRVFAFGTSGRLYGLDLASGELLWQSHIGPMHEQIEKAKKAASDTGKCSRPVYGPYGQLLVLDGILLVPDWMGGVRGLDPAGGKLLWTAGAKGGLTSGYNCPAPVTVEGRSYTVCVNRTGDLRLLDHRKGTVLWSHALGSMHLTQPVFGKELLLAFDASHDPASTDKRVAQGGLGVLTGYRLSLTGAERVWQLDSETYATHLWLDAGPSRKIATRGDGIVFHAAHAGSTGRLAVIEEATGKVLNPPDDVGHFWCINLWGDRMFFQTDIQHGAHAAWRVYDSDPARFKLLSEARFPSDANRACGYEVPLHEIYADGFVYVREWQDRWGGISCFDLRAATAATPGAEPKKGVAE